MWEMVAAGLVVFATIAFTIVAIGTFREGTGAVTRLRANLALPCGLVPLLAVLALAGPRSALGMAILIVGFQVVSGTAESHLAGRLTWLESRRRRDERRAQEPAAPVTPLSRRRAKGR